MCTAVVAFFFPAQLALESTAGIFSCRRSCFFRCIVHSDSTQNVFDTTATVLGYYYASDPLDFHRPAAGSASTNVALEPSARARKSIHQGGRFTANFIKSSADFLTRSSSRILAILRRVIL